MYDGQGRIARITSHSDDTGQENTIVNEVKYSYDTLGQVATVDQDHADKVGTGTAHLTVQYAYDDSVDGSDVFTNGLRQKMVTYPQGRKIHSTYGSGGSIADLLGRLDMLEEDSSGSPGTDLVAYSYNGTSRPVIVDYPVPDFKLDKFFGYSGYYFGLDRFGRDVDHYWGGYSFTFDVARVRHGYDYASNRKWREDVKAADNGYNYDEYYTYDNLHRLKNFDRGNLTGGPPPTGIASTPSNEEDYTLDQLGNWSGYVMKAAGSTTLNQTRYHNAVNEIDGNGGNSITASTGTNWADPVHDTAGNMTTMPNPQSPASSLSLKYDAWNRMVEVKSGMTTIQTNEFDGLGRRIVRDDVANSDVYDYYYNEQWQLLEERLDGDADPLSQYVWHPYYVDALAVRYWNSNTDSDYSDTNEGAHFYAHDANYNVTDIVNASGGVMERYLYSPYGQVTYLNANYTVKGVQVTAIGNTHFYTGRERDPETGLQLNRHRFFAWHLGRWTTRDPIGYKGSRWNLFEYVSSHPTKALDRMALSYFLVRAG